MTCGNLHAQVLKQAPDFSGKAIVNGQIKEIKPSDYKGKYIILIFYPFDFTFVCPTEILAYNDRMKEFTDLNTEILTVSVDSVYSHLAWQNVPRQQGGLGSLKVTMLSDISKKISYNYGVLLDEGCAARGNFIIDPEGIIRHLSVNEPGVGRSVDETLRLLKAIQFHAKHGEVCPINWQPGADTIKPDPAKSRDYFAKNN